MSTWDGHDTETQLNETRGFRSQAKARERKFFIADNLRTTETVVLLKNRPELALLKTTHALHTLFFLDPGNFPFSAGQSHPRGRLNPSISQHKNIIKLFQTVLLIFYSDRKQKLQKDKLRVIFQYGEDEWDNVL